jgi:hypothetical protein
MRLTVWPARLGLVIGLLVLTACEQAATTGTIQPTATSAKPRTTPTAASTPTPVPALALEKVGATSSPSGYLAFAVINNPSGQTAMDVKVEISAINGASQAMTRRSATIRRIPAGQRAAAAIGFSVGPTLPARFTGRVTGVRWSPQLSEETAKVASANFVQDARTPSVRVHLVNSGQRAVRLGVTAVCWDTAGNIRGGGTDTVAVGPDAKGHDATIDVYVSTVPSRCEAFGVSL